ncbi:hypothetical protein BCR36DRAFT_373571 [Piromyces finnis]|uniref:Uncharacterized protein n=1 Tax=Piromyces finnis TaxID=1754191 RepID=A0A1Y1V1H7_9FUNG|nr:hypothetical protein BCR36DRAFT_373571 [Piromyces finnis]|eukprot:ORX43918.1 hypothetical protein BCR36DRAFT_373571 [Piromyces finnis]
MKIFNILFSSIVLLFFIQWNAVTAKSVPLVVDNDYNFEFGHEGKCYYNNGGNNNWGNTKYHYFSRCNYNKSKSAIYCDFKEKAYQKYYLKVFVESKSDPQNVYHRGSHCVPYQFQHYFRSWQQGKEYDAIVRTNSIMTIKSDLTLYYVNSDNYNYFVFNCNYENTQGDVKLKYTKAHIKKY